MEGPDRALEAVDALGLDQCYLFHAIRADLLRRLGRNDEAATACRRPSSPAATPRSAISWFAATSGQPWRFFAALVFALPVWAASFARNLAIASISFPGTGSVSGNRIVPLLLTSWLELLLNAATRRALAG